MRVGDAPADGKAQAGAVWLGGHEGIEDGREQVVGYARTGVRHLDEQRAAASFGEVGHTYGQLATGFHRLNGI